jgi:hypothetical protein
VVSRVGFRVLLLALLPILSGTSQLIYVVQPGTPVGIQNFILPEAGCNWSGVGGQVFDQKGSPVSGLIIKINGTLEGNSVLVYAVTGSSLQLGPGGFDVYLSDHPIATQSVLSLQLLDVTGNPLTGSIPLDTFNECTQNLLLVNLVERFFDAFLYLPLISR